MAGEWDGDEIRQNRRDNGNAGAITRARERESSRANRTNFQVYQKNSTDPHPMPESVFFCFPNLSIQKFTLYTSFLIIYLYILFFHPVFDSTVRNHLTLVAAAAFVVVFLIFLIARALCIQASFAFLFLSQLQRSRFSLDVFSVNNFI